MDRTPEFYELCRQHQQSLGHPVPAQDWTSSSTLLPPVAERSTFQQAATKLHEHIAEAQRFIHANARDFIQIGRVSARDRAQIEADVVQLLRTCDGGLRRLREALPAASQKRPVGLNATAIAHAHGLALVLHTCLSGASSALEAMRASVPTAGSTAGRGGVAARSSLATAVKQAKMRSNADAGQRDHLGAATSMQQPMQQEQQQQQQQETVHAAHLALMEDLATTYEQTRAVERQMAEVAALNRALGAELSSQLEMSEALYQDAVAATDHIERANVQLRKTVDVNKGGSMTMFWILVSAGIALLVIDFLYPG